MEITSMRPDADYGSIWTWRSKEKILPGVSTDRENGYKTNLRRTPQ
jgi:hypothetical protein